MFISFSVSPFQVRPMSTPCLPRHWRNFPSVNFLSKISWLVYVGLFWYLNWSIIRVSCIMFFPSPGLSFVYFLFARAGEFPSLGHIFSFQYCDKICQLPAQGQWFSPCTPASSNSKIDHCDMTEILLKLALNPIEQTNNLFSIFEI